MSLRPMTLSRARHVSLLALASMLYIYRFHLDKFPATVQRALQNISMALT